MIQLDNLGLNYGPRVLFENVSAVIHPRDRIGLVGANGAGKSTLLRILAGVGEAETGKIERARHVSIGYLPQEGMIAAGRTVYAEVESACGDILGLQKAIEESSNRLQALPHDAEEYLELLEMIGAWEHQLEDLDAARLKSRIERILLGLGFTMADLSRDCREFSGGWQMRIALAKLLLKSPSLLLLDEPTNHLDLDSLRWLEAYLRAYEGAIVLVSHDRSFLDSLTNRTFALVSRKLETYSGNYSFFETESVARREQQERAYLQQQKEIAKTERFIERFKAKATKAAQAQSRIKMLDKIERLEAPEEEGPTIEFRFPPAPRSGRTSIELKNLHKSYGPLELFKGVNLEIERGERIAIVGPNGAGKSTLSRILAGAEPFQSGERILGHNVVLSYFAQHQADELDPEKDALENVSEGQPLEIRQKLRTLLGAFLFTGDDVFKKTRVLSGGEKSRLALAKMLLRPTNCLIMDEPTNHLDMRSKEVLQDALKLYDGTLLIVSHDRAFLDPLVTKIIEVRLNHIRIFHGTLSEFIAKKEEDEAAQKAAAINAPTKSSGPSSTTSSDSLSPKERRRREAELRAATAPLRKEAAHCEQRISELEQLIKTSEAAMMDPAFFKRGEATTNDVRTYESAKAELESTYSRWEKLTHELEGLEKP